MDDVSEAVLFLSGLITYPVTPAPALLSTARSDSEGHHGSNVDEMELQRLTFVVMGSLISQARPLVSGETWTIAIQVHCCDVTSINGLATLAYEQCILSVNNCKPSICMHFFALQLDGEKFHLDCNGNYYTNSESGI